MTNNNYNRSRSVPQVLAFFCLTMASTLITSSTFTTAEPNPSVQRRVAAPSPTLAPVPMYPRESRVYAATAAKEESKKAEGKKGKAESEARSEAACARSSGGSSKGGKSRRRNLKGEKSGSVGTSGCGGGVPDREYPPAETFATSKKGAAKSGCAGKRIRGRRGLKGSNDAAASRVDESCAEGGRSGEGGKKGGVGGKKGQKGEYPREYPPDEFATAPQKSSSGKKSRLEETEVEATDRTESFVACTDIARGLGSGVSTDPAKQYAISADLQVATSDEYPISTFYSDLQSYLQSRVALDLAGCSGPEGYAQGKITKVVFGPPTQSSGECSATSDGHTCYPTTIVVNVHHSGDLSEEESQQIESNLISSIEGAQVNGLGGVSNVRLAPANALQASASLATSETTGGNKAVGVSMGMLGVILVSLAAMVAFRRRQRALYGKDKYADMDDSTFAMPNESELLGPECDLDLDEANNNNRINRISQVYSEDEGVDSVFILDDLQMQDSMSMRSGMTRVRTPEMKRNLCC